MYYLLNLIKCSVKKQLLKKILENGKKYWKSQGKVREFCQFGKVGTLSVIVIRITDRMGPSPIVTVIHTITIDTMLSFNYRNNGHGLKNVTCKQTLNPIS